ncbi:MAG: carbamoyltransferase HypF [Micrococcales bacterium]|nr:carbamoyltransferase HypF [Micrococcales bacterium]
MARRTLLVTGVVQGVGFRPHVYRLAAGLGVLGSVRNTAAGVVVDAQAPAPVLDDLARRIATDAPPLADVQAVRVRDESPDDPRLTDFAIIASADTDGAVPSTAPSRRATVPPDCAVCDDCLTELFDPADRRFRHPFITCTDCGPRFTIITGVPYDRPATSMAGFPMCPRCAVEYHDPADRRFHAQPIACPDCGPRLWATDGTTRTSGDEAALARAQQVLAEGGTVAVKGLGGYHLACRADDETAVARLRARKHRPDKPFALMARDRAVAARLIVLDDATTALLTDPARPIVLVAGRQGRVVDAVAPGVPELGVMLAYTPLHHLLMTPGPSGIPVSDVLVMTSANLSDEPLYYRDDQTDRLLTLADLVLGHDRPIVTPCDDSVFRLVDGAPYPVRRSRGHAPLPVRLGSSATLSRQNDSSNCRSGVKVSHWPTTFAVGAELKNTVCVLDGRDAVCSQHLGDMAGWESQQVLAATSAHVMDLYQVTPTRWAADAHPAYQTRAWAQRFARVPLVQVQHHRAHVASLLAEHHLLGTPLLAACFDGTGYGDDGAAWGGEWLLAGPEVPERGQDAIVRVGSLTPVGLVGGDRAVREPWRMALAHLHHAGVPWSDDLPPVAQADPAARQVLAQLLDRWAKTAQDSGDGSYCPVPGVVATTSMGRLFDAVAALLGVRQVITYEAQAAIDLETLAASVVVDDDPRRWTGDEAVAAAGGWGPVDVSHYPGDQRRRILDPAPVVRALVHGVQSGRDRAALALGFHVWVGRAVVAAARDVRATEGTTHVGLTGGVFANVLLVRQCAALLHDAGFEVVRHRLVPCNDGGLSLGQAVLAAAVPV